MCGYGHSQRGTPPYSWTLASGSLPAGLTLSASGAISGTPTTAGTASFAVKVTDSASLTATSGTLALVVNAAALQITTTTVPAGTVGTAYSTTLSATGGTPPYSWTLTSGSLPAGLTLSASGTISGTPTTAGTASFAVKVTDSASLTATSGTLALVVNAAALQITTTTVPAGTVGTAYSTTLSATGGTPPYSWTLASGSLPAGLTLSASGAISGTPTTAGTASFAVKVTDSASLTATSGTLALVVNAAALQITTTTVPAGTVGTAYSTTLSATGGTPPYSWTLASGSLPAGLTLSASGAISGTPTTAGTASFTVNVPIPHL